MKPVLPPVTAVFAAALLCVAPAAAQSSDAAQSAERPAAPRLALQPVVTKGLSMPLYVCSLPTDAGLLYVLQKGGQMRAIRGGVVLEEPVLDLSEVVTTRSEQGLLGMAFHPAWPEQPYVYLNYTGDGGTTHVSRFTLTAEAPLTIDPASEQVLLKVEQPWANHNAGHLAFSPKDGYLYVGFGDGGAANDPNDAGQDPQALLGKMLRIDVDGATDGKPYGIPADNPFVGKEGWRPEIWAYGLRNPWRYSFDRVTGDLYIGDVGQNKWEEVDFQPADSAGGENYGWRLYEGNHTFKPVDGTDATQLVMPVHEVPQSQGNKSMTGGYVYRGKAMPWLHGTYFYGDYVSGHVGAFRVVDGQRADYRDLTAALSPERRLNTLVSFGEDADGELYFLCLDGRLMKLVAATNDEG